MIVDPYQFFGLDPKKVTDESVRRAYMEAVRNNPPDRDPQAFERIRNAYNLIDNERKRIHLELFGLEKNLKADIDFPDNSERPRVGLEKWMTLIEEESKRIASTHPYERLKK